LPAVKQDAEGAMKELVKLAIFVLAVYGVSNAIAVLKIGKYFLGTWSERKTLGRIPYLGDLFYCPPCLAFWFGMAGSVWFMSPASDWIALWWKAMIVDGLVASGVVYLSHLTAERLGHGLGV
jgi:hypothetical protein